MWNRITALMIIVAVISLLIPSFEAEARRGGGGGGRGGGGRGGGGRSAGGARGGGAYRGGHTMNRTPTMSRASHRPAASQARQRTQTRPSVSQGRIQQSRPSVSQGRVQQSRQSVQQRPSQQRPSSANRTELRNQVNKYAQNRPAQNINREDLVQRGKNFSTNRNSQIAENRRISERTSQRLQQSRWDYNKLFDRNFFDRHDIDLDYTRAGANWWRPAAWGTLAAWGAWNWATPYYYDDEGYAYPLTDQYSYAYPNNTTTPYNTTASVQMQPIQSTQASASESGDWLPLGVFAVAHNANDAPNTNRYIQLAVNRSGEINGVLYNSTTDAAQDLTGMVDPSNQKAYWSMANRTDSPIASTGIYNLTEDQTPINVHFSDGSDQTWSLVRLQQGQ